MTTWELRDERTGVVLRQGVVPSCTHIPSGELSDAAAEALGIPVNCCPQCEAWWPLLVYEPEKRTVCFCAKCRFLWLPVVSFQRPAPRYTIYSWSTTYA